MKGKKLYCLGMHFKCFYEQLERGENELNLEEPCRRCKFYTDCESPDGYLKIWMGMRFDLYEETGIKIEHEDNTVIF